MIVVSAAILVFRPSASGPAVTSVNTDPIGPPEATRDDPYRELLPPSISPVQENYINIYGESSMTVDSKGDTVINVPKPNAPAVPEAKPAEKKPAAAAKPAVQAAPAAKPAAAKPAAQAAPAAKPAAAKPVAKTTTPAAAKPAASAPAAKPAAAAETKTIQKDYWVQAGAFLSKELADRAKSTLGNKGLSAVITNQEKDGDTYYRVRIGPYTSQNEADYWLAMLKAIDGFQDSRIFESKSYR